jgi:hypothetical protein
MPLESLYLDATPGTQFGFESQINDNDSDKRDHISHWWIETGDPSWNNSSTWGTAVFQNTRSYTTAVKDRNVGPVQYELAQNFPNPFNPTTTIAYGLKNSGKVRLSVFDIMGKEVAVLVDGSQAAGTIRFQFNANNLSTMYLYDCRPDQMFTKKMTLVNNDLRLFLKSFRRPQVSAAGVLMLTPFQKSYLVNTIFSRVAVSKSKNTVAEGRTVGSNRPRK